MERILITGASGFLGWNLCRLARRQYTVTGVTFSHALPDEQGLQIRRLDLRETELLAPLLDNVRPQVVLHTAGLTRPNQCQADPELSFRLNVEASGHLAALCAKRQIPFFFTSTDLVFDGTHPPYTENASRNPVSVYGTHKALAEDRILAAHPAATVCRMPLMFGHPGPHGESFLQPWLRALAEHQDLRLFTDEYRTPLAGHEAAAALLLLIGQGARGIFHLGGERISRYDFGLLMAEVFGFSTKRILPCLQREVPMAAPRPADVSMDSARARTLGFHPAPLRLQLETVRDDLKSQRI